jgi:hypothetical protein
VTKTSHTCTVFNVDIVHDEQVNLVCVICGKIIEGVVDPYEVQKAEDSNYYSDSNLERWR